MSIHLTFIEDLPFAKYCAKFSGKYEEQRRQPSNKLSPESCKVHTKVVLGWGRNKYVLRDTNDQH